MAEIVLRNNRKIRDYSTPYVVAEMGTNHGGSMEKVYQMIDAAKEAGCTAVKFQSWSTDSLYSKVVYEKNPIAKRMVNHFALSEEQLKEACNYCHKKEIDFSSTPYSEDEVDYLVEVCNAPYVKVASMDLNNYPFLKYIARKQVPIVLATGMAELGEIKKAVKTIEEEGNSNICLLHCISIYPPDYPTINLKNILGLRKEFPQYPIGLSDHSLGIEVAVASMAMGVALIEKHLTLDKSRVGWDNDMAMEPDEMKHMIESCKNVYHALGSEERVVGEAELRQRERIRRSIVSVREIRAGEIIREDMLTLKRPGTGMPPEMLPAVIGKTAVCDIGADEVIQRTDLS